MRSLFFAIAGAVMLMAFAPAKASAAELSLADVAPIAELSLSAEAVALAAPVVACGEDACGASLTTMKNIGLRYATASRRGRSFTSACNSAASAHVRVASIWYATGKRGRTAAMRFASVRAAPTQAASMDRG